MSNLPISSASTQALQHHAVQNPEQAKHAFQAQLGALHAGRGESIETLTHLVNTYAQLSPGDKRQHGPALTAALSAGVENVVTRAEAGSEAVTLKSTTQLRTLVQQLPNGGSPQLQERVAALTTKAEGLVLQQARENPLLARMIGERPGQAPLAANTVDAAQVVQAQAAQALEMFQGVKQKEIIPKLAAELDAAKVKHPQEKAANIVQVQMALTPERVLDDQGVIVQASMGDRLIDFSAALAVSGAHADPKKKADVQETNRAITEAMEGKYKWTYAGPALKLIFGTIIYGGIIFGISKLMRATSRGGFLASALGLAAGGVAAGAATITWAQLIREQTKLLSSGAKRVDTADNGLWGDPTRRTTQRLFSRAFRAVRGNMLMDPLKKGEKITFARVYMSRLMAKHSGRSILPFPGSILGALIGIARFPYTLPKAYAEAKEVHAFLTASAPTSDQIAHCGVIADAHSANLTGEKRSVAGRMTNWLKELVAKKPKQAERVAKLHEAAQRNEDAAKAIVQGVQAVHGAVDGLVKEHYGEPQAVVPAVAAAVAKEPEPLAYVPESPASEAVLAHVAEQLVPPAEGSAAGSAVAPMAAPEHAVLVEAQRVAHTNLAAMDVMHGLAKKEVKDTDILALKSVQDVLNDDFKTYKEVADAVYPIWEEIALPLVHHGVDKLASPALQSAQTELASKMLQFRDAAALGPKAQYEALGAANAAIVAFVNDVVAIVQPTVNALDAEAILSERKGALDPLKGTPFEDVQPMLHALVDLKHVFQQKYVGFRQYVDARDADVANAKPMAAAQGIDYARRAEHSARAGTLIQPSPKDVELLVRVVGLKPEQAARVRLVESKSGSTNLDVVLLKKQGSASADPYKPLAQGSGVTGKMADAAFRLLNTAAAGMEPSESDILNAGVRRARLNGAVGTYFNLDPIEAQNLTKDKVPKDIVERLVIKKEANGFSLWVRTKGSKTKEDYKPLAQAHAGIVGKISAKTVTSIESALITPLEILAMDQGPAAKASAGPSVNLVDALLQHEDGVI